MLHINDLSYRIDGRLILDKATAAIPSGHKVGLVGRNGSGKTTLLKIITGDLAPEDGSIMVPKASRIGHVAQEAPGTSDSLIDWVLAADVERANLLAEAETARDAHRIAEIQIRLSDIGAHAAPARAAQILAGLGFDEPSQKRPCAEFSGGWRMRVALAAVLFLQPELLLLDEPTNYLDLEGALWLDAYLRSYLHTVLIVSHDRNLLNSSVASILHLHQGRLTLYSGGYDRFEETRREQQQLVLKLKKKQDEDRKRIEAFVDRFRAKATKATQAQSRIKALARMKPIAAEADDAVVPFTFPAPARALASPLIRMDRASAGYEPDMPVLNDLNLRIDADDRIALLGQNGNGKSTFAKLISGRLPAMGGDVWCHNKVTFGYFAQHQLDELIPSKTPFEYISDLMPDTSEAQRRARIGAFGFGVEKADNPCETLSGGEKARLLLMLAAFHGPHVFILDEPTNHLDVDSRQALIQALNAYEGAVILISHDRHLIEACADRLWVVEAGAVKPFEGDLDDYRRALLETVTAGKRAARQARPPTLNQRTGRADQRKQAAERRSVLAPLKKALRTAEESVNRLTAEIAAVDDALADPTIYDRDPARAQALLVKRGQLAKSVETAEADWLSAMEDYEQAEEALSETSH
ncbi:MAG: ABC-F family ATP-binding cassette domain-containing protein [Hyphomicrobiaceae bacterium]